MPEKTEREWTTRRAGAFRLGLMLLAGIGPLAAAEAQGPPAARRGFEVVGPAFVAVRVRDDEAASAWYQRTLGLAEVRHLAPDDRRYSIRLLTGGGLSVELIWTESAAAVEGPHLGLFKAGFYVDDIDAAFAALGDRGVDRDQRVFLDQALQARSFVFRDLEGNRLQVFQRCDTSCRP